MEAGNVIESHAKYPPKLPLGLPNRENVILRGASSDREGPEELPRNSWGLIGGPGGYPGAPRALLGTTFASYKERFWVKINVLEAFQGQKRLPETSGDQKILKK